MLYHFGVTGSSGGFVGVDVFFVISGFLMSGIIIGGLEHGRFSLWQFYLARARRIVPALLVLCLLLLIAGWFLLMPEEYQRLGQHARESLYFSANLQYLGEAGYFDVASQEKWLLHTWSLAVEWQFYLLLPLLLMAGWRRQRLWPWLLAVTCLLSLAWSEWLVVHQPDAAFYTLGARAWEMLAGGLAFWLARRWQPGAGCAAALEASGLVLILGSMLLLNHHSRWPGSLALLPVTGTMLVLVAARARSVWTGHALLQWLGTRSYSVYLWHWPLVVIIAYLEQKQAPLWIGAGLALSLLLGHLSYVLVETPSRHLLSRLPAGRAAVLLLLLVSIGLLLAQQVRKTGFPQRLPATIAAIESERRNANPRWAECSRPEAVCRYGHGPLRAVIIGDSHADAVVTALAAAADGSVLFKGVARCPIAVGLQARKQDCVALNHLLADPDYLPPGLPVLLVGRTGEYLRNGADLPMAAGAPHFHFGTPYSRFSADFQLAFRERQRDTLCALATRHPLYLLQPLPEMPLPVPTAIGRDLLLGRTPRHVAESLSAYQARTAYVRQLQSEIHERCGAILLDPVPALCDGQECPGTDAHGRPYYRDQDHLSEYGNRRLLPVLRQMFTD